MISNDHYFAAQMRIAQSVSIVRQIPMIILGNGCGSLIGAYALQSRYGWLYAAPLVLTMWALLLPIVMSWLRLHKKPEPPEVSSSRIVKLTIHSAALGMTWAGSMVMYLPGATYQTMSALVLGCIVLAMSSAGTIYVLPRASIAYSAPIFSAALFLALTSGAEDGGMLAVLIVSMGFGVAWILYANWMNFCSAVRMASDARHLLELAETAVASRNTFIENVSHEIRTPLTSISGYAALLESEVGSMTTRQRHSVEHLKRAASTLMCLADDLIAISMLDAGQAVITRIPMDIRAVAMVAAEAVEAQLRAKGLLFELQVGQEVPLIVEGDPSRTHQILSHLLDNAVKYTAVGTVVLRIAWTEADHQQSLAISVIDTGIGIAPEKRDRVFQRFSQIDDSTRRRHGGTGLGLAICRETLALMGGDIEFVSDGVSGTPVPWARKRVVDDGNAVVIPRRQRLGDWLRTGAPQRRFFALEQNFVKHANQRFQNSRLDDLYTPVAFIGEGTSKRVYELEGGEKVLLIKKGQGRGLTEELTYLKELYDIEVPVCELYNYGSFAGKPAMVMKKYEQCFHFRGQLIKAETDMINCPLSNQKTIDDLTTIRDALEFHQISILDLQLAIDKKGHVCVLDPAGIMRNYGSHLNNAVALQSLDRIIKSIEARLALAPMPHRAERP